MPFKRGYKAASLPPLGKSDHATIFLLPEYKQRIAREVGVTRDVQSWSEQTEANLQDALSDVDMFRSISSDVSDIIQT